MTNSPVLTQLTSINGQLGTVCKILRSDSSSFSGFGEAYITSVNPLAIKGWKCHQRMILNLVVLEGRVKFVFYNPNVLSFEDIVVSTAPLCRLTVPAKTIFAFQGLEARNKILNLASIPHDPDEVESYPLATYNYTKW